MADQTVRIDVIARAQTGQLGKVERDLRSLGRTSQAVATQTAGGFTALGRASQAAGTALLIGVGASLAVGTKAAIEFESAFAGVRKTVDASEGTLQRLSRELRDLALAIPISVVELAKIAELGGQLGVPVGDLEEFTEVIAKLGVTTNLEIDEAATGLARFANVMGTSTKDFDRLGSGLVELGNNFATTEAEILTFGTRLAGIGATVGATEGDVLGLATAFTSLGEAPERGATAIQRAFVAMLQAVDGGGEKLRMFADVAGLTADEFARLFKEDPTEAFLLFEEGLGGIIDSGEDVSSVLKDLGLGSQRTFTALIKGANGFDVLRDAVVTANLAIEDNVALNEEAEKRFGTTESIIQLTVNQFKDLGIEIGDKVLPGFQGLTRGLGSFIEILRENIDGLQTLAFIMGGILAGRLLVRLGTGLGNLGIKMGIATKASDTLLRRTQLLKGGINLLSGAVGATVIALGLIVAANAAARARVKAHNDAVANLVDTMEEFERGAASATDVYRAFVESVSEPTSGIGPFADFSIDLDDPKIRDLLESRGTTARNLFELATTDAQAFEAEADRILTEISTDLLEKFGDPRTLSTAELFALGSDELTREKNFIINLLDRIRGETEDIGAENERRQRESFLEDPGNLGALERQLANLGNTDALDGFSATLFVTEEEYLEALESMSEGTEDFATDFSDEWNDIISEFTGNFFEWKDGWDGYEKVQKLSTAELTKSLKNWRIDNERLFNADLFILETYGANAQAVFRSLPSDLQRGLAAGFAEGGEGLLAAQLIPILETEAHSMNLAFLSVLASAPQGAGAVKDAWENFFETDLNPKLTELGAEGGKEWVDGAIEQYQTFQTRLREESPAVAAALDDMLATSVEQITTTNRFKEMNDVVIPKITQDMTTFERIQAFHDAGFDWAQAIALGFASFDLASNMGNQANKAADTFKEYIGDGFKISSPSKVAMQWGEEISAGFRMGLEQGGMLGSMPTIDGSRMNLTPVITVEGGGGESSIIINNPQHKDDDILDGVQKAATLVGLTQFAETTPGRS